MNFLIINPYLKDNQKSRARQPLSLAIIANILRNSGHEVDFFDCNVKKSNKVSFDKKYKYLIITSSSLDRWGTPHLDYSDMFSIINMVGKIGTKTILTGPHGTVSPKKILEESKYIKAVIIGEPEFPIFELCQNNFDFSKTSFLAFRLKNKIIINNFKSESNRDLDILPLPAYDLLPMNNYFYNVAEKLMPTPFSIVETSRGCPFNCIFCLKVMFDRGIRYRSLDSVFKEINILVNDYGVKSIYFQDLEFTINKKRLREFCKRLLIEDIKIKWACAARINDVEDSLISLMSEAGCVSLSFGVESLSNRVLKNINKQTEVDNIKKTKKICDKYNINFNSFCTGGHIGESPETVLESLKNARLIEIHYPLRAAKIIPYPGTKLFEKTGLEVEKVNWKKDIEPLSGKIGNDGNYEKKSLVAYFYYYTNKANWPFIKKNMKRKLIKIFKIIFFYDVFRKIYKYLEAKNTREDFNNFVKKYSSDKKTLVLSSHDCDYKKFFSNRVKVDMRDRPDNDYTFDNIDHFYNLPFDDNSFDIVLATAVLEHCNSPELIAKESERILKPGGKFIVTCSFVFPLHEAPNDFFHMTKFGLKRLLEKANFKNIELFDSSSTMKGLSVIMHRIAFQTKMFFPLKVLFLLISKILPHMQFFIKEEYGKASYKKHEDNSIICANSFAVAYKKYEK